MNILILEDDPIRMVQFRQRLSDAGLPHTIVHCQRAAEAIAALASNRFDLILLDHDLGGRTDVDHTDTQEDCGMRVAEWFSIRPERVRMQGPIVVHSINGPAALRMVDLIGETAHIPYVWTREVWRKYIRLPNEQRTA